MAALESQIVDSKEFIDILDYKFEGNDVTVQNKRCFIEQLRKRAAVYVAANATGINKVTAYRWRESDPEFASAWDEALEDAADVMESSTYEEALGINGKPGNPLLKMFWLKAHRPKYRDRVQVDIQGLQDEINQRMEQLGLRELPAMITDTVDNNPQPPALIPHSNYTGYSTQVHSGNTGTVDPSEYPPDVPDSPPFLNQPASEQKD